MRVVKGELAMEMPRPSSRVENLHGTLDKKGPPRHARSLNKTLSSQQLSWDSVNGLHTHMSARTQGGDNAGQERGDSDGSPGSPGRSGGKGPDARPEGEGASSQEEHVGPLEPQPKCDICGITTTSQAHMEAHKAGRKHKRRMEAAAGRGHVKPSAHYCALCEISTTSSAHLALHLVGRAHRRRQKALDEGDSLHPVSLLGPHEGEFERSANGCDARQESGSGEDAVSSGDGRAGGQRPLPESWKQGISYVPRNGDHGPPPAARTLSQPEFQPPREHRHSRGNSADLSNVGVRNYLGGVPGRGGGGHPSPQRPMHPGMLPQMGYGSPMQHPPPYPMGMYPYAGQYYPPGTVPQFPAGHGSAPYMPWWLGHPAPPMSPQMPQQRMHLPGQYPVPQHMFHGGPSPLPMMGMQQMPGGFPRPRPYPSQPHPPPPPRGMGSHPESSPPHSQGQQQQQSGYNCEVCNVQTDQLEDLKQHLRGRQHKRRLYAPSNTTE